MFGYCLANSAVGGMRREFGASGSSNCIAFSSRGLEETIRVFPQKQSPGVMDEQGDQLPMPGCNPARWLWGLIPILLVVLLVIAGEGPKIERDLARQTNAVLNEKGHGWASIRFSGREATLTGTAFTASQRDEAVEIVRRVAGVGSVQDKAKLLPGVSPYTWWATREDRSIKIKGHVPSEADKQTILGIVKATMPDLSIDDRMKLASGAPPTQRWLGAISFALNQLGPMTKGSAHLSDMQLEIVGEASTDTAYRAIQNALQAQLPDGLDLTKASVVAPAVSPYVWSILHKDGKVRLTGHIPDEKMRTALLDSIEKSFGGAVIEDGMTLGSGQPEGWPSVMQVVVTQLSRLDEGEVAIEGTSLTMMGMAADAKTADAVVSKLRNSLPPSFKSEEEVRIPEADEPDDNPPAEPTGSGKRTMARPPVSLASHASDRSSGTAVTAMAGQAAAPPHDGDRPPELLP